MPDAVLKKLLIEGYSDPECTKDMVGSIEAAINPESYSRNFSIRYTSSKENGANAGTQVFAGIDSGNFDLDLIVDGTGLVPLKQGVTVDSYITDLEKIVYQYKGTEHRPNYLKITWGKQTFIGVCERLTIRYTLFNPDGTALRASVKLNFLQTVDYKTKSKEARKSSPDLTHVRTVKAGDNLPLMAYRIYGDSSYYIEVAKANNLQSFLAIEPGDQIYFPPLKK